MYIYIMHMLGTTHTQTQLDKAHKDLVNLLSVFTFYNRIQNPTTINIHEGQRVAGEHPQCSALMCCRV